jgi:hypothetical protein
VAGKKSKKIGKINLPGTKITLAMAGRILSAQFLDGIFEAENGV